MQRLMFGPLVLLAASVSPSPPAAAPAAERHSTAPQRLRATTTATVSIRIISGARFGSGQQAEMPGADRRSAVLSDANGLSRPAELLEFQ